MSPEIRIAKDKKGSIILLVSLQDGESAALYFQNTSQIIKRVRERIPLEDNEDKKEIIELLSKLVPEKDAESFIDALIKRKIGETLKFSLKENENK